MYLKCAASWHAPSLDTGGLPFGSMARDHLVNISVAFGYRQTSMRLLMMFAEQFQSIVLDRDQIFIHGTREVNRLPLCCLHHSP